MPTNSINILAVAIGGQTIGFAIFKEGVLQYYAVKTFAVGKTRRKAAHIAQQQIIRLITSFQPDVLAIRQATDSRKDSVTAKTATKFVKEICHKRKLEFYEYSPRVIRQTICQSASARRQDVISRITRFYPELSHFLKLTHRWEQAYYANMLDAIAVGVVCAQEMNAGSE